MATKIKKNDKVKVKTGIDRNKTGKVLQVLPSLNRASIEGINIRIKNLKSQKKGEKGQRVEFPAPVHLSNLQVICPKCGKVARIGFKILKNNKKVRQCKKCKEVIDE